MPRGKTPQTASDSKPKNIRGRVESPQYTPQQIIDGLRYNDTEPNMLPDDVDDIAGFKAAYDRFDDRYWDLVDEFWEDFGRSASDDDKLRLYRAMGAEGPRIVAKGLRKKEKEGEASSDEKK